MCEIHSKLTIRTPKRCQILTLNRFHKLLWCFHCWPWTSKYQQRRFFRLHPKSTFTVDNSTNCLDSWVWLPITYVNMSSIWGKYCIDKTVFCALTKPPLIKQAVAGISSVQVSVQVLFGNIFQGEIVSNTLVQDLPWNTDQITNKIKLQICFLVVPICYNVRWHSTL